VGEDLAGEGTGQRLRDLDDLDAFEGERCRMSRTTIHQVGWTRAAHERRIHTMDAGGTVVDSLVVRNGRVAFAGRRGDINPTAGEVPLDLGGRTVLPASWTVTVT